MGFVVFFVVFSDLFFQVKAQTCYLSYHLCDGYDWCCPDGYVCTGSSSCLSIGAIVGACIGCAVFIAVVGVVIYLVCFKKKTTSVGTVIQPGGGPTVTTVQQGQQGGYGEPQYGGGYDQNPAYPPPQPVYK